jgi:hypothetical protein
MSRFENDPLATVNEPRWVVISDHRGNPLGQKQLCAPVDQRRALTLARQIVINEGYRVGPVTDRPYVKACRGSQQLVISLEEDPP